MAQDNTATNIILQTTRSYSPLDDRAMQRTLYQERQMAERDMAAKATKRANTLNMLGKLSTQGLPSRLAAAAQSKINKIYQDVEDGKLDPDNDVQFRQAVQQAGNEILTYKQVYSDAMEKFNLKDMVANPDAYVVPTYDKETETWRNSKDDALEAVNQYFSGEFKEGDSPLEESYYINSILSAKEGVDLKLGSTIQDDILQLLPSLLKQELKITDIADDDYNRAVTTFNKLDKDQRDQIVNALYSEKGRDVAKLLLSQGETGEISEEDVTAYLNSKIPTGFGTSAVTTSDEEQRKKDRLNELYTRTALQSKGKTKEEDQVSYEVTPVQGITLGGRTRRSIGGIQVSNFGTMEIPIGNAYYSTRGGGKVGKETGGGTMTTKSGGLYIVLSEKNGAVPIFKGKASIVTGERGKETEAQEQETVEIAGASYSTVDAEDGKKREPSYGKKEETDINIRTKFIKNKQIQGQLDVMEEASRLINADFTPEQLMNKSDDEVGNIFVEYYTKAQNSLYGAKDGELD